MLIKLKEMVTENTKCQEFKLVYIKQLLMEDIFMINQLIIQLNNMMKSERF